MTKEALESANIRRRVTLFCGHYGSGKTTLAIYCALALKQAGERVALYDLDVVNPYFRARDVGGKRLEQADIPLIVSEYAATNVDMPSLPAAMYRLLDDTRERAVADIGGDDRGALALGRLSPGLRASGDYDMLLVYNPYRPLTGEPEAAREVAREIEKACGLRFTAVIHNPNLGAATQSAHVLETLPKAQALADMLSLPLAAVCALPRLENDLCGRVPHLLTL